MLKALRITSTAAVLALAGGLLAPVAVAATPDPGSDRHAAERRADDTVRLIVRTRSTSGVGRALAAAEASGAEPASKLPEFDAFAVETSSAESESVQRELEARADVVDVYPARRREFADVVPNDPQWSTYQASYLKAVSAPRAWGVTRGSSTVRIAVIDSGVDVSHPDLASKIVGRYNAVTGSTTVTDSMGHGTSVASVAAGATNNGRGIAGAGFNSSILAVKVADANGTIWTDVVARGIRWAADHGAKVINISLGGGSDPLEANAVAYARSKGVVVVASAGNSGRSTYSYPAAYPGVIAVGATDRAGLARTSWSNYGSWVDVGAPGSGIRAAKPGGSYASVDGTSFSSPLVAGEAALLRAALPTATEPQIAGALRAGTGADVLGFDRGLVNFRTALDRLVPTTVPVITAPPAGNLSGVVPVTATSTAPKVRFAVGATTKSVAVVGGTAATTLETYGLSGVRSITATDCRTDNFCAPTSAAVSVNVTNAEPVMTKPAEGSVVGATLTAAATAPGGAVRFTVDGKAVATDPTAPFGVTVSTIGLANGTHQVSAQVCNTAGTACDTGHPAAARTITVKALRPVITSIGPSPFSPNRDGRRETTRVAYRLDQTQTVVLRVRTSGGSTVFGPKTLGTNLSAGSRTYTWSGKNNKGVRVGSRTYTVLLSTSRTLSGITLAGRAGRTVRVDVGRPGLGNITDSPSTFYPYQDGYRDRTKLSVTFSEPLSVLNVHVYNRSGTRVRTVNAGPRSRAGRTSVFWNGRYSSGTMVRAGRYYYRFVARDKAGNQTTSARYAVDVIR